MWTCLLLKLVSNETSFSCKHIRLILEPLELDLNTLQVPDRWVPSPPTIKLFLEPLSLYLWLLSQPTDPLVLFNEMFTDLVSGYELLLCKERCKPAPPTAPMMNVFSVFRRRICASVGDCPHLTSHWYCEDISTHEQFIILGLLLVLTLLPLSPAKSFTGFFFFLCICHFVQRSMNQQKCKRAETTCVVSWVRWQNSTVWLQPGDVKRDKWAPPLIFPSQYF